MPEQHNEPDEFSALTDDELIEEVLRYRIVVAAEKESLEELRQTTTP